MSQVPMSAAPLAVITQVGLTQAQTTLKWYWTPKEELTLIDVCKEAVADGQRGDNGWKTGAYAFMEKTLAQLLPGHGILEKHITNKLNTWGRDWSNLQAINKLSGIEWDNESSNIVVKDENKWKDFCKVNKKYLPYRFKVFPHYNELCEIFGKKNKASCSKTPGDTATASSQSKSCHTPSPASSQGIQTFDLSHNDVSIEDMEEFEPFEEYVYVQGGGTESVNETCNQEGDTEVHSPLKPTQGKKRGPIFQGKKGSAEKKKHVGGNGKPSNMAKFLAAADATWTNLATMFNSEETQFDEKAKKLVEVLGSMPNLTKGARSYISWKLMENSRHLSLFLQSNGDQQLDLVEMLLLERQGYNNDDF